jgi:biotin transport system substrate-specific component
VPNSSPQTNCRRIKSSLSLVHAKTFCLVRIFLGSLLLVFVSQFAFSLSFTPIPISLQTLGISLLVIALPTNEPFWSVILYLIYASIGLPVLSHGQSNPNWFYAPGGGYLIGFIFSSYLLSNLLKRYPPRSFLKTWLIFSTNEGSVLIIGTLWLSYFIGMENSFAKGMLPFLVGALAKITVAASIFKMVNWMKGKKDGM